MEKPDENDEPAFAHILIPGTMNGMEMIEFWEHNGCFEVWAEQYEGIGPGRKYAESMEYVQAMRGQTEKRH